jgi:hypothetical protein
MDRINELLARLGTLTLEELAELDTLIGAETDRLAEEAVTEEVVTALDSIATAREQYATETAARATAQAELETRRETALGRLRPAVDATDDVDQAAEADQDADAQVDEPDAAADVDAAADQVEPLAVAAAATRAPATTNPRPSLRQLANARPAANRPGAGQQAAQSRTKITDVGTGKQLKTRGEIAEAMARALTNGRGPAGQFSVVTAAVEFPTDRHLRTGHDAENEALVASALAPEALVAAGGLCAPILNLYDVEVVGSVARPARDTLATFGADRGGINLRQSPVFQDWTGALGDWTFQNDIDAATAGSPDPTKPVLEALCPGFQSFYVEATTQIVRFRNVTARFDPEGTTANMKAVDIAFARKAELKVLAKMAALSLPLTGAKVVSATRDVLAHIDKVLAAYRDKHRFDRTTRFHMWVQQWVLDMIRTDMTRGANDTVEALAVADEAITAWFTRRGVNVTWVLDGRAAAQTAATGVPAIAAQAYGAWTAASAIPGYPAQLEIYLAVEGDFLFLDSGEIDLGVVRDSNLNSVNAYQMFKEEFFGVAFRGIEALQVVVSTEPTGQRAGTVDTSAVAD